MREVPRVFVEAISFALMVLTAFGGLIYALTRWREQCRAAGIPAWRRIAMIVGLLAVTAQAALFLSLFAWPHLSQEYALLSRWARWVVGVFLIAVPCALAGKGAARWWLLLSSVTLFLLCSVVTLTP